MLEPERTVNDPINVYRLMADHWELPDDLVGGTMQMRAKANKWLPAADKETVRNWENRVSRSILDNKYSDALETLVSKPFSKEVQLRQILPDRIVGLKDNIDGEGRNLTQFAKDVLRAAIHRGIVHVLVDYANTQTLSAPVTLATEQQLGLLPRFVQVDASNLIGWQTEVLPTGEIRLIQIRIRETRTEADGPYGDKTVEYVRVYGINTWEVWRESDDKKSWMMVSQGTHTFGKVPLFTMYTKRTAFMLGEPPLENLAWLNLTHYQSSSDQRNILHFARAGLLFAKGLSDEEMMKDIVVGGNASFKSANKDADMKFVEHQGNAINAGRQDIVDLEEKMAIAGLQPYLKSRSGDPTATGRVLDETAATSEAQCWIRNEEILLEACFKAAAQWTGVALVEGFGVDIFNDFSLSLRASEDIKSLIMIRQAGEIDRMTFLREIKRRALLAEDTEVQKVADAVDAEGIALSTIGRGAGGPNT